MSSAPRALLVAAPGPSRRLARATLRALGWRVRTAAEPFEGTALFVEQTADLVVLSLARFRPRDVAFFRTVRRRAPAGRILLLVPEGKRDAARRALRAGADAWIPEPFYAEELSALVQALRPVAEGDLDLQGEAGPGVRLLAREVAHAVNNPLQVLHLLGEDQIPAAAARTLVTQVERIRDALRILEDFARLGRPVHVEGHLGAMLGEALEAAAEGGSVHLISPPPHRGPTASFDPAQIRYALDCTIGFLGAHAPRHPMPLKAGIHRLTAHQGRSLGRPARQAVRAGHWVEIAFKGRDVHLDAEAVGAHARRVIWNHEETRQAHPGLAAVSLVARQHAGHLLARPARGGTVLGIAIPFSGSG